MHGDPLLAERRPPYGLLSVESRAALRRLLLPRVAAVRSILDGHRLPGYSPVLRLLEERYALARPAILWREIFNENMDVQTDDPFQAAAEFAWRVNEELFPVDLEVMDEIFGFGENPLQYPIPFMGYGVPWELESIEDVERPAQPMVATVAPNVEISALEFPFADAIEHALEAIDRWWERHGYSSPPQLEWPADRATAVDLLAELSPPLDGLACLYLTVVKGTGNVFLDVPGEFWQADYLLEYGVPYWTPADVKWLAREFADVREEVARLETYREWFESNYPVSEEMVMRTLMELE